MAVDDTTLPVAETARRVGAVADALGLTRPSYVHVRRYVVAHRQREAAARARRRAIREILVETYVDATTGRRFVDAYELADRLAEANARATLA